MIVMTIQLNDCTRRHSLESGLFCVQFFLKKKKNKKMILLFFKNNDSTFLHEFVSGNARGNKFYPGLPADHAALRSPASAQQTRSKLGDRVCERTLRSSAPAQQQRSRCQRPRLAAGRG